MKRISFIVLLVLVWTALAPFTPFSTGASALAGAGFTTINRDMDGPGHCKNGNPPTNCNIYDGKQYVWLSGGPDASRMGPDGRYFFAVLAPSAQHHPNDGGAGNLSDDRDPYTNRIFTIKGGRVSGYSGTHLYDNTHSYQKALIQLSPYANTPNPGGVYILAVCSLANGYPVKASNCKYDQFKAPPCTPASEIGKFTQVLVNDPVEARGAVAPNLTINARGQAIHIASGPGPSKLVYSAGADRSVKNGGIDPTWDGFGDFITHDKANDPATAQAPFYRFTFSGGVTVSDFQLHMLDFGDFNPYPVNVNNNLHHEVTLQGYDASGKAIPAVKQVLAFDSSPASIYSSTQYGDLILSGDALTQPPVDPGNYLWHVTGKGIAKLELTFSDNYDPNVGFDGLAYTTYCP